MGGVTNLSQSGEFNEVNEELYLAGAIIVGTTEVEAKVGASRAEGRQRLRIFNNGNSTIYFGPSGVTILSGEPLYKKQWIELELGDLALYLISDTVGNDVRIQEIG